MKNLILFSSSSMIKSDLLKEYVVKRMGGNVLWLELDVGLRRSDINLLELQGKLQLEGIQTKPRPIVLTLCSSFPEEGMRLFAKSTFQSPAFEFIHLDPVQLKNPAQAFLVVESYLGKVEFNFWESF